MDRVRRVLDFHPVPPPSGDFDEQKPSGPSIEVCLKFPRRREAIVFKSVAKSHTTPPLSFSSLHSSRRPSFFAPRILPQRLSPTVASALSNLPSYAKLSTWPSYFFPSSTPIPLRFLYPFSTILLHTSDQPWPPRPAFSPHRAYFAFPRNNFQKGIISGGAE